MSLAADRVVAFDPVEHIYTEASTGRMIPGVTMLLDVAGWYEGGAPWYTAAGRDRGSDVHAWTAAYDRGAREAPDDPRCHAYIDATAIYGRRVRWQGIEQIVVHWGKRVACTVDRHGQAFERPAVVEIKAGQRHRRTWQGHKMSADDVQTALQSIVLEESTGVPARDRGRYVLYLREDGKWKLSECTNPVDFDAAREAMTYVSQLVGWGRASCGGCGHDDVA